MRVEVLDQRNAPLEVLTPPQRVTFLEVFQGLFFTIPAVGDVHGPPSSVDGDFALFSGTSGKIIEDLGLSLSTDGTLAADSDFLIPSQKAVKTYADAHMGVPATRLINTSAPLAGGGDLSADRTLSIPQANGTTDGFLSHTDWITFNSKQGALLFGALSAPGTDGLAVTGGAGAVIGGGTSLAQHVADAVHNGYLSSADWVRFNGAVSAAGVSSWNGRVGAVVPLANDYAEAQLSFTDILANNVSTAEHGFAPKLPGDGTKFFNGLGQYIAIPGSGTGNSQLISGGGVAWTGTGFNYIISAAVYLINGVQYSSPQTNVTLAPADPSQDRIDVFYVDVNGAAGVITGIPGTPPIEPSVDPASQLFLTFAYVPAASSVPVITNENIYLEDTEYTMSTNNAGQINLASTNNPYQGTKCIEGTAVAAGSFFTGVKPSGTLNLSLYNQIVLQLRSKATWPSPKSISIFWLNGTTVVGSSVAVKDGTFGFNSSNTTGYQQIVIPVSNFGTGTTLVDRIRSSVSGGGAAIGWYIDNIILQAGGGGGGGGGTVTNFSAGNLLPLFTTTVATPTSTPVLSFVAPTNIAAHNYYGNNSAGAGAAGFHQIDYSELTGTPTAVSVRRNFTFGFSKSSGIATGKLPGFWTCPFSGTIVGWNLTVDVGTLTFRIWKIASGTAQPTVANNINTSGLSISTGTAIRSSVVSDFTTTTVTAGDIFACEVTAVAGGMTEFGGAVEILQS